MKGGPDIHHRRRCDCFFNCVTDEDELVRRVARRI